MCFEQFRIRSPSCSLVGLRLRNVGLFSRQYCCSALLQYSLLSRLVVGEGAIVGGLVLEHAEQLVAELVTHVPECLLLLPELGGELFPAAVVGRQRLQLTHELGDGLLSASQLFGVRFG